MAKKRAKRKAATRNAAKRKTAKRKSTKRKAAKRKPADTKPADPPWESERAPPTASEQADRRLAKVALAKLQKHQRPTREELAALKRVESKEEERRRWEYYRSIPQKHWRMMSGRQARTINEQAERYGLPMGGPYVDLTEFVPRFHNFLSRNSHALNREDEDGLLGGPDTASLERLRRAQAEKVEMQNAATRRELLPTDEVHQCFSLIAGVLRQASDELVAEYGDGAYEILATAVSTAEDMLRGMMRTDGDGDRGDE